MDVYTTEKEVRAHVARAIAAGGPMERAVTLDDLKIRALDFGGRRFADPDTRSAVLEEAIAFPGFAVLDIPANFESFIENGRFILGFLQEAAAERVSLDTIAKARGYEMYERHVKVLEEVRERYAKLMLQSGMVCPITMPDVATVNEEYLRLLRESGERIRLHYNGYLSRYEFWLLEEIGRRVPTVMRYVTSRFSGKMNARLSEAFGEEVHPGRAYEFDFSAMAVLGFEEVDERMDIVVQPCSNLAAQAGYVHAKIEEFVADGIAPDDIAVVIQKPETADFLYRTDRFANLNLSGGFPLTRSRTSRALAATVDYVLDQKAENRERWERVCRGNDDLEEAYRILKNGWHASASGFSGFIKLFDYGFEEEEVRRRIDRAVRQVQSIADTFADATLGKAVLRLLRRLEDENTPHTGGGKVTVMQPLEARQVDAKAYIFLDFNDGLVPSDSVKDIFLDTEVRNEVGLPTYGDREDLQRYYYELIFLKAEKVAIAFRETENETASRLVSEFPIAPDRYDPDALATVVLPKNDAVTPGLYDGELAHVGPLTGAPVSATMLKTFLTCGYRYHFRYLMRLKEPESAKSFAADVGNLVHEALRRVYDREGHPVTEEGIYQAIYEELRRVSGDSAYMEFQGRVWANKLRALARRDAEDFAAGWRVVGTEVELEGVYNGVAITGKIDRIDRRGDEVRILDYKTGKYDLYTTKNYQYATDFQLEFYRLLAEQNGYGRPSVGFYDLSDAKIVEEPMHEEKLELLAEKLELLKAQMHIFRKCEETKHCRYCPFAEICGRG